MPKHRSLQLLLAAAAFLLSAGSSQALPTGIPHSVDDVKMVQNGWGDWRDRRDWRDDRWRDDRWRDDRGWRDDRPRRVDPFNVCRQTGGNIWRVPAKDFGLVDMRPTRNGLTLVTLSFGGRLAYCSVDRWGNVADFR